MAFSFYNPYLLFLLFLIPLYLYSYWRRERKGAAVRFSSTDLLARLGPSPAAVFRHLIPILRCLVIGLVVLALARPRQGLEETRITVEGIDIALCVDVSGSMELPDFELNGEQVSRLTAAKDVIARFITVRDGDRIGMVVFASLAYTQCPLTIDYGVLLQLLEKVHIGMIEDGTAIGSGIAAALNRLRDSEADSRIIILLTDGENNTGTIGPATAAEMARSLGIKIYTIGIGPRQSYRIRDRFGRVGTVHPLDPTGLKEIASITKGEYFSAWDTGSLEKIFELINRMEKTTGEEYIYTEYKELYVYFILAALVFLLAEIVLINTRFRRLP